MTPWKVNYLRAFEINMGLVLWILQSDKTKRTNYFYKLMQKLRG